MTQFEFKPIGMYYKNRTIINDATSWSVTLESSIMLLESSVMLLESLIMLLESI
jgi:hypothetical protein